MILWIYFCKIHKIMNICTRKRQRSIMGVQKAVAVYAVTIQIQTHWQI